jgi:hypothetical protein
VTRRHCRYGFGGSIYYSRLSRWGSIIAMFKYL